MRDSKNHTRRHRLPSHWPTLRGRWLLVPAGLSLVMLTSCSNQNRKPVFPVQGEVFVQSQPAVGAMVIFRPADGEPNLDEWTHGFPRGTVDADGTYHLSTYDNDDGAPAGKYVVLVSWGPPVNESEEAVPEEEQPPPDRLGGRFLDPNSTPLRATVEAKSTVIPRFDLK